MNAKSIRYILGWILNIEALLMLLPVATAVFYREEEGIAYALVVAVCAAVGALLTYKKPKNPGFYAKEGFVCTALGWILMSVFGCLPFMLTDEIPSFIDCLLYTSHDEVEEHFEKLDENAYRVDCSASLEDFMEFFDEMCIRDRDQTAGGDLPEPDPKRRGGGVT